MRVQLQSEVYLANGGGSFSIMTSTERMVSLPYGGLAGAGAEADCYNHNPPVYMVITSTNTPPATSGVMFEASIFTP